MCMDDDTDSGDAVSVVLNTQAWMDGNGDIEDAASVALGNQA